MKRAADTIVRKAVPVALLLLLSLGAGAQADDHTPPGDLYPQEPPLYAEDPLEDPVAEEWGGGVPGALIVIARLLIAIAVP